MKNNSIIIIVLGLLAGVMFYGASSLIKEKDDFPDYSGAGFLSPQAMGSGISTTTYPHLFKEGNQSYSGGIGNVGSTWGYTGNLGGSRMYSGNLGVETHINASPRSNVGSLGGARSSSGGIYASSASSLHSYSSGGSTSVETHHNASHQSGSGNGGGIASVGSIGASRNYSEGLGDLGVVRNYSEGIGGDAFTRATAVSTQGGIGVVRNYSERLGGDGATRSYTGAVGGAQSNASSRRRAYYWGTTPLEDDGTYYDEDEDDYFNPPTSGSSNIPGLGAGTFDGQQVFYKGGLYQWNGSSWDFLSGTPVEVDIPGGGGGDGPKSIYEQWVEKFNNYYGRDPIDDTELEDFIYWWQTKGIYTEPVGEGVWVLMLLALLAAAMKRARLKVEGRNIEISK